MDKERNALKAGIFILFSVALIFSIMVGIRGVKGWFEPTVIRTVTFSLKDDVGGLRVGDDVRIGGFKVGVVRTIEVGQRPVTGTATTRPSEPTILVTFTLPRKYELRNDAIIGIQGTVTGQSWLNFESLGKDGTELKADEVLVGEPNGLSAAIAMLKTAAPKIDQSLTSVQAILGDVRGRTVPLVNETLTKYGRTADTLTSTGQEATGFLTEMKAYLKPMVQKYFGVSDEATKLLAELTDMFGASKVDFKGMMKNLNSATGAISAKMPDIMERVDGILKKVDTAVVDAGDALKDIKQMMGSTNSVVSGNKGTLDEMIRHLNATALNLELGSAEVRARPWRLLYTPKKGEVNNLVLFDSAREFAKGAIELDNAARALRDAANAKADSAQIEELKKKLDESFKNFAEVEKKLWEQVKE
ncbi:MAG TPA: MlaD family protein [Tepidisphaeraceae bacterium]|nr:MlaD family protein [Tepidisphaeraceae bacterium]